MPARNAALCSSVRRMKFDYDPNGAFLCAFNPVFVRLLQGQH